MPLESTSATVGSADLHTSGIPLATVTEGTAFTAAAPPANVLTLFSLRVTVINSHLMLFAMANLYA